MKRLLIFLAFALVCHSTLAKKRALLIGIGNYPAKTGWKPIQSLHDLPLIRQSLKSQGFLEADIDTLTDGQATYDGILEAFRKLTERAMPGDVIVIHYSGHGQQIFDDNQDETDGKDEALVPYDAFVKYSHNYKGEHHLRDDHFGSMLATLRNKIGKNGQLLVLLDSCHSGSASRGRSSRGGQAVFAPPGWTAPTSPVQQGSDMDERTLLSPDASPFVMISGAEADELNYEYKGCGSLSYAFSQAMANLSGQTTYRQLFAKIAVSMNVISPKQTPVLEGDKDIVLFKGDFVVQQPYSEVIDITSPTRVTISAGNLQGIFEGCTFILMPSGATAISATGIHGKVIKTGFTQAEISLDRPLKDTNPKSYWAFPDKRSYGDLDLSVNLDAGLDAVAQKVVSDYLTQNGIGQITGTETADIILAKHGSGYALTSASGIEITEIEGKNLKTELPSALLRFAQGKYLKELELKNQNHAFTFRLLPVIYDKKRHKVTKVLEPSADAIMKVYPDDDYVILEVENLSSQPIYFNIVEIASDGRISPFYPNDDCAPESSGTRLLPGQKFQFTDCAFSFSPPYEQLMLKGFASGEPLNLMATVVSRGKNSGNSAFERFFKNSYEATRGRMTDTDGMDISSAEFLYEILRK